MRAAGIGMALWVVVAASGRGVTLAQSSAPSSAASLSSAITVQKQPALVQTRVFKPGRAPTEMPKARHGEDAFTSYSFSVATTVAYTPEQVTQTPTGGWRAAIRVTAMTVKPELKVTIWLPEGAPSRLVAHEQGHRQIVERIYERADEAARQAAGPAIDRTLEATGSTREAAMKAAATLAGEQVLDRYLGATSAVADRAGDRYDELTDHGRKLRPTAQEAARSALQRK